MSFKPVKIFWSISNCRSNWKVSKNRGILKHIWWEVIREKLMFSMLWNTLKDGLCYPRSESVSGDGCSFSEGSIKNLKRLIPANADNDEKSVFKIIVYGQTDALEISCFYFLFAWVRITCPKWVHNHFLKVKHNI